MGDIEEKRRHLYISATGLEKSQIRILKNNFVVFTCNSTEDVSKCISSIEPFKNNWVIPHKKSIHLTSLYQIRVKNDYYRCTLNIEFETAPGIQYWIDINFNHLPPEFKKKFFKQGLRGLYSSESVYVGSASNKNFEEMRVVCYKPTVDHVSWYGGDHTITSGSSIEEMIEFFKDKAH